MNIKEKFFRRTSNQNKKISNTGSTMVELIVAFAVLLLAMASWSKVVTATTELTRRSVEMRNQRVIFEKCFYLGTTETVNASTYKMETKESQTYGLIQTKASGEAIAGAVNIALPITLEKKTLTTTTEGNTSDIISVYTAK